MAISTKAQVRKSETKARARDVKPGPPLKWAGGKRWLIPHIQAYWEKHSDRRLVEPFCGGLAVALGLTPEKALLNDINAPLMNFYAWLKRVSQTPGSICETTRMPITPTGSGSTRFS